MSESGQRGRVTRALRELDAIAVENPVYPGTPDVNYIGGWLELKWLRRWPKGVDTPVRIDHYTPQQKAWGLRRKRRGGKVHVLLQVQREWLLMDAEFAARHLGEVPRAQLLAGSERVWLQGLVDRELVEWLRSR